MGTYNKIMQFVWLGLGIGIIVVVTVLGIIKGFDRWASYYFLAAIVLVFYFIRRYMMKRMDKHQEYLQQKETEKRKNAEQK